MSAATLPSAGIPCMHCTLGYYAPDPECPVCWGAGEICGMCEQRAPERRGAALCRECRQSVELEESVARCGDCGAEWIDDGEPCSACASAQEAA